MVEEMEEKLWDTAAILADEKKNQEAVIVINSIASHAIGRFSGKPVEVFLTKEFNKDLEVQQFPIMKALSKQVSDLVKKQQYEEAKEKAVEYMDGIVGLLADNQVEERKMRMSYLKHLIRVEEEPTKGEVMWAVPPKYPIEFAGDSGDAGMSFIPASPISIEPFVGRTATKIPIMTQAMPISSEAASVMAASIPIVTATTSMASDTNQEAYTTSEAAQILHVSDQTIRRMCDAGKFPEATRTEGGHWRIPKKYFKVTLEQSKQIDKDLADIRKKSTEGGAVDEFNL